MNKFVSGSKNCQPRKKLSVFQVSRDLFSSPTRIWRVEPSARACTSRNSARITDTASLIQPGRIAASNWTGFAADGVDSVATQILNTHVALQQMGYPRVLWFWFFAKRSGFQSVDLEPGIL